MAAANLSDLSASTHRFGLDVLDVVVLDGGGFSGFVGMGFGEDSSSIKSSKNYRGYSSSCGSFIYHSKVDVEKQVFAGVGYPDQILNA